MADLNANINVGIETTQALNQLKALQKQISQFHQSVAKSSGEAAVAQRDLQRNFLNSVNSIQGFSAELKTVRTTAESFTNSLEKNKFSMREYFRYAGGATKTFGKNFKAEFSTIEKTAIERVKTLQTQYIKMGRDAQGAMQAIAIRPTVLNMKDLGTQTAIAAQKQVLFNQLVKQGSTNLLNFGKNTQWAGRQLMVGFTLPLATLGMTAGRVFFDMEKAAIKFKKVYGDLFTAPEETKKAMDSIVALGEAYATYGIAVSDTLDLAADAAAAGFAGVDLQNQTTAALKLSVLGQLDLQKALETTISLQNAFQLSSADLAGEIDFLNAVENQTVVALEDITTAVPRVAPVIQALGGDVRDLAFFLAAMKEGGVNAAQGANALKSGLASLINPSEKAATMLAGLGVNIRSIISRNQGDLAGTVFEFATALDKLDPLKRAQAIEQLFGKFQFARISALFDNITREGTQAKRVLDLAGSSASELAALSESELGVSAASSMNKFRKSVEEIKVALVPIGELFVEIATPFVEFGTQMLKAFNKLPDGVKTVIGSVITILGGIGPIALMTFGLINNGIANMIKFFATVRLGYLRITGQAKGVGDETQYMTQEQLEAAAAAASLDQAHAGLTQRFTAEKTAVDQLRVAYEAAAAAGAKFALNYPGMMRPVTPTQAQGFAGGGVIRGPGTGTSDSIPAMLSNGEAVIPAKQVKEYAPLIEGMIAGNLPGFANGVMLGMPKSGKATAKNREAADAIYEQFLKSSYANTPPTEYGHQIAPTSGHSFPIFGLGGVYEKDGKRVFVKPVMDETAALAEIRGTQITRQAHGLQAPEQRIVVIRDPMDPKRERRFLALESDLDAKFIQNEPKALFNEEQYFRQLVASLVRVDKDLAAGNVFGDVVADVGPAGVFDRASGARALKTDLPSMEEQAIINLLGIKGGAKRAFAESTLALMAGLTPQQYHQRMIAEIQRVLPALKKTVADFGLSSPTEAKAYDAMIKRLEAGLGVDWSKFHAIHSAVKIAVPKKPKATEAVNLANGGMVRGPGGPKDDAIPANLSNGEAVIDAATVKKNPGIIAALFQKKKIQVPGYAENNASMFRPISAYGNVVGLHSEAANKALNIGTQARDRGRSGGADPSMLAQELRDAKGKILAPIINEIAKQLGATTQAEVEALIRQRPELIQLAKDVSEGMANDLDQVTEALSDPEYAEIFKRNLDAGISKLKNDIKIAVEKVLQEITVIEDNTKLRIRSKGEVSAVGRIKAFESKPPYTSNMDAYQKTAAMSEFGDGSLPSKPVLTHLDKRPKIQSSEEFSRLFQDDLAPQAQEMKKRIEDGVVTIYKQGFADLKVDVPESSVAEIRGSFRAGIRALYDNLTQAVKDGLGVQSPSKEFTEISNSVTDGVRQAEPEVKKAAVALAESVTEPLVTQATKNSAKGSSFGNINTKEPVPAVGNAPREVVQAISQEATATKSFVGDIKASFAAMRENIAREFGWVKEEFKTLTGGVKENTSAASQASIDAVQKNLQITEAANNQILINGEKAGFNYVAAMAGRDGAVEAVVTKKTAEIIKKATEQYNSGALQITKTVSKGIKDGLPEIEFMGEQISKVLGRKVGATIPDYARPGDPEGMQGPSPQGVVSKLSEKFDSMSKNISNTSMAISALSGIAYMFGGELQEVTGFLSMLSGAIYGLVQIVNAYKALEVTRFVKNRIQDVQEGIKLALTIANNMALGGMATGLFVTTAAIWTMLGPIGLVVAGLAAIAGLAWVVSSALEEQQKRINGLGDAAFVAGEKLKSIANVVGFEPTRDPEAAAGQIQNFSGLEAGAGLVAGDIRTSEGFKSLIGEGGDYESEFEALKNASVEDAQTALNSLIAQLIAVAPEGFDVKQIQGFAAALAAEAGQTDLNFDLAVKLDPYLAENADAVVSLANEQTDQIAKDYEKSLQSVAAYTSTFGVAITQGIGMNEELETAAQTQASSLNSYFEQLKTGLLSGTLDTQTYLDKTRDLLNSLSSLPEVYSLQVLDNMLSNVGIDTAQLAGIDDFNNKLAVSQALLAGVDVSEDELKAIDAADDTGATPEELAAGAAALEAIEKRKVKVVQDSADAIAKAKAQELKTRAETDLSSIEQEIISNDEKIAQAKELVEAGLSEADAIAAVTDETWQNIFAQAKLDDLKNDPSGNDTTNLDRATAAFEQQAAGVEKLNNAREAGNFAKYLQEAKDNAITTNKMAAEGIGAADAQLILNDAMLEGAYATAALNGTLDQFKEDLAEYKKIAGGAGGAASDPVGDAIKALKEQKEEILNTSKAYAGLRKRGMDANKAMRFAQNPQLLSAMNAGLKVGSRQWDEIIKRIKAAEVAVKKFQMATVSGQKEYFDNVYGKVQDFISASKNLMQSTFEVATSADRSLISKLENKIKDLNAGIQDYEYALEEIAEKEEAINKEYDKKAKALENVRRINEDILRQQKSQLSIADALSQGDIAAAASAMQQSREENARAAMDSQGNLLDIAKQAQLDSLTAKNGLTREEIEKRIKALKKEISEIERGELAQAQSRIDAAQRKLDVEIAGISVLDRTAEQWDKIKAETDKAQTGAELYNKELRTSIGLVKEMVAAFEGVPGTVGSVPPKKQKKKKKADGGYISGPGTGTSDSIPAMLSDGEYVIKASSVSKFGQTFLDSINAGVLPGFKKGGKVSSSFENMTKKGQADFDRAQYVAKSQAASKANVGKKGKAFSEMFKNLIFDASSPEMAALSVLPFGLGKVAKGLKGKKFVEDPKGYAPRSPIGGKAESDERVRGLMGYNMSRYLGDANSIYSNPERSAEIARFFQLGEEMIPGGLQMYRVPSAGEVMKRLPRNVGDIYRPGTIKSAATSGDLQALGELFTDLTKATGGKQNLAPGIAQIFTRNAIPGIQDLTKFLSTKKLDPRAAKASQFMREYVLGPNTSYRVNSFTPGTKNSPPSWVLEAFIEKFAKGGMVKPSYFGGGGMAKKYAKGGMVKPSYFAGGGMVKPSYFEDGGFAKGTDTIPAMLTPGEFVINRDSAKTFSPLLSAMNDGGRSFVSPVYPEISRDYASANVGGGIFAGSDVAESNTQVDNSVYNYSLSVNVEGSNASPDQIANVVMRKLQDFGSQRVRGQVLR